MNTLAPSRSWHGPLDSQNTVLEEVSVTRFTLPQRFRYPFPFGFCLAYLPIPDTYSLDVEDIFPKSQSARLPLSGLGRKNGAVDQIREGDGLALWFVEVRLDRVQMEKHGSTLARPIEVLPALLMTNMQESLQAAWGSWGVLRPESLRLSVEAAF